LLGRSIDKKLLGKTSRHEFKTTGKLERKKGT